MKKKFTKSNDFKILQNCLKYSYHTGFDNKE